MDDLAVKRLALILATQAVIEGMKAKNAEHKLYNTPPCYNEEAFNEKAEELRVIASKNEDQL